MRALICLSGLEGASFVERSLARLPSGELTLILACVVDTRPIEELGYVRRALGWAGRPHVPPDVADAELRVAEEVLTEATAEALRLGIPADRIETHLARGRPEREIVEIAARANADTVVIGARHRGTPLAGPESIGPVARYVLDHTRCDVVLLRGAFTV